jgi:serine/threonine-protein kinase HipA
MIGETSILMVTRFDRTLTDELRIERLHQEDFCQALGVLPERKYEFEDGPSVVKVVEIIRNVSSRPAADLNTFVRAVALHFLLGNSDAHGKNFALLYHRDSGPQLAPLYDIVCTDVYDLNTNLAMYIGGEENPDRVDVNAWRGLAEECGLNATLLIQDLQALAERVLKCADAVSRTAAAEGWRRPIIDAILATITRRAAQIQELSLTR